MPLLFYFIIVKSVLPLHNAVCNDRTALYYLFYHRYMFCMYVVNGRQECRYILETVVFVATMTRILFYEM